MVKEISSILFIFALVICASAQKQDHPLEVQKAREKFVKERGNKVFYTNRFDLSGLPEYKPLQQVSGTIRQWGANYFADGNIAEYWETAFKKYHPNIKFDDHLKTSEHGIPSLYTGMADLAPMGRQALWDELLAFQRETGKEPLEITVCTSSYNVPGWTFALGIFVNKDNPLSKLTLDQLDGIFGSQRTGGWKGLEWDISVARGPEKNIRTWGQLGLKGDWADKPINVYGYNLKFHFPDELNKKVMHGGDKWTETLMEYANKARPDGSGLIVAAEQFMADLSKDKYGIAYTGISYLTPQTKTLALNGTDGNFYDLTLENVQNRKYPLIRDVYMYAMPNKPIDPKVKEFLRFILSREGQEAVMKDGKYLPLTAEAVREQLKKLE